MLLKDGKKYCKCVRAHEVRHPLPLYEAVRILDDPPPFLHQLRTYLIDGPFRNQKGNKDIWISYSLKYERSKKYISLGNNKW